MDYRPNDCTMEVGETRNGTFQHAGSAGDNTIDGDPTVTCSSGVTLGTVTTSGLNVTVPITAVTAGENWVKVSVPLSSDETLVGVITVNVQDSTCSLRLSDYQ